MKKTAFGLLASASVFMAVEARATTISFTDFSSTAGLTLNGSAAAVNDGSRDVLRITPAINSQGGSFFSTSTINLASNASFSSKFVFNINNPHFGGADGLVFVVQTQGNNVGGIGGGIGYQGITPSLGVEFDTWNNGGGDGFNANHVGVNLNGSTSSVARYNDPGSFEDGNDRFVWVDYNGITQDLEIRLNTIDLRPGSAVLSYASLDLQTLLGTPNAFVGFTSGTGAANANHDIVSWEFRDSFNPVDDIPGPAPLTLLGLGLLGLGLARRRRG